MSDPIAVDTPLILDITPTGTTATCRDCSRRIGPADAATVGRQAIEHCLTEHLNPAEQLGNGSR